MTHATSDVVIPPDVQPHGWGATGMWTFLATDAMGFGGLFIAYGFLRARAATWPDPRGHLGLVGAAAMSFALLASAFTVGEAARAVTARARTVWLAATLLLGMAFLGGEAAEYARLWTAAAPVRLGDLYGGSFYVLTGYHALHVAAGLLWMMGALWGRSARRSVEVGALYWQFVDLAWTPIFTFLYLVPAR
ncbi:MAG TPA: heme-copper oxidase subunit III [Polyangia bacterium]|nr:heme-copper oxidase subunit III [Polyangia bacterium]